MRTRSLLTKISFTGNVLWTAFNQADSGSKVRTRGHSLVFTPAFSLKRVAGTATPGELEIPHDQLQPHLVLLASHQDWTKQGSMCDIVTWSWSTSGSLYLGCNHKTDLVTWSNHRSGDLRRNGSVFTALRISQLRTLPRCATPSALRKNAISAACT